MKTNSLKTEFETIKIYNKRIHFFERRVHNKLKLVCAKISKILEIDIKLFEYLGEEYYDSLIEDKTVFLTDCIKGYVPFAFKYKIFKIHMNGSITIPENWIFNDFEKELAEAKKQYDKQKLLIADDGKKATAKLIESAKSKLTKTELEALIKLGK